MDAKLINLVNLKRKAGVEGPVEIRQEGEGLRLVYGGRFRDTPIGMKDEDVTNWLIATLREMAE